MSPQDFPWMIGEKCKSLINANPAADFGGGDENTISTISFYSLLSREDWISDCTLYYDENGDGTVSVHSATIFQFTQERRQYYDTNMGGKKR